MDIRHLPIDCLRESPFNYRKTFNATTLAELTESIKAIGIQQPLKARPIPGITTNDTVRYELIFGHRRLRAAIAAELDAVPVIVEEMTDEDVRITQLSENLQRDDVNPIEEAEALRELNMAHRVPVEQLMADTGKSKSHIYATMRLTRLADVAKQAVIDGTIGREIAVLIATLPTPLHGTALGLVTHKEGDQTVALSYRLAKKTLGARMTISIKAASFDPADRNLVGYTAHCQGCHRLSDNDPALLDALGTDVCTDTECFGKKSAAHLAQLAAAHKAAGGAVLEGEAATEVAPYPGGMWFHGHKTIATVVGKADGEDVTVADVIEQLRDEGIQAPVVQLLIDHRDNTSHELIRNEDMQSIIDHVRSRADEDGSIEPAGCAARPVQAQRQPPAPRVYASERHKLADEHAHLIRKACQAACLSRQRSPAEVHVMLQAALNCFDGEADELMAHFGWRAQIDALPEDQRPKSWDELRWVAEVCAPTMSLDDCATALVWLALDDAPISHPRDDAFPDHMLALASMYDIDVEAVTRQAQAANESDDEADELDEEDDEAHA